MNPGDVFLSWDDVYNSVQHLSDATFSPFVIGYARTTVAENRRRPAMKYPWPEDVKYSGVLWQCTHHGQVKSRSTGLKKSRSHKVDCKAEVFVSLDKKTKMMHVQRVNTAHNHEIGPELYSKYPQNRILTKEQKMKEEIKVNAKFKAASNVPSKDACGRHNKSVTSQDVRNIKKIPHSQDRKEDNLNETQLLLNKLDEVRQTDTRTNTEVGELEQDRVLGASLGPAKKRRKPSKACCVKSETDFDDRLAEKIQQTNDSLGNSFQECFDNGMKNLLAQSSLRVGLGGN